MQKVKKKYCLHQIMIGLSILVICCNGFQTQIQSPKRNLQNVNPTAQKAQQNYNVKIVPVKPNVKNPMNNMIFQIQGESVGPTIKDNNKVTTLNLNQNNNIPLSNDNQSAKPFFCSLTRTTTSLGYDKNIRQRQVATLYGFNMYIDTKDVIVSNSIMITGSWQPENINIIGCIVKPDDYVLNLGSQSGLQALIMGKIIGPNGKLFIFEPYSFSNLLVTKNIELNQLTNITKIYKIGASDEKIISNIGVSYMNTGGSQIAPQNQDQSQNIIKWDLHNEHQNVETDLVDNLLPADIKLNFALIDVQKMQVKALKGMKKIIQRSPNLVIMTQWQYAQNPRKNKADTVQFIQWMINREYRIYSYSGGDHQTCKIGQFRQFTNVQDLLIINEMNIFFFPSDYKLPSQETLQQIRRQVGKKPAAIQNKSLLMQPTKTNPPEPEANNNLNPIKIDESNILNPIQPIPSPNPNLNQTKTVSKNSQNIYCSQTRPTPPVSNDNNAREKLVMTNYGFSMYIDQKDFLVSNMIDKTGTWEPHFINLISHIVKAGDNVINLGSQSGLEAVVMGKIVGPTGKLFIFQPYSFSNFLVTKNVQINGLKNITTIYNKGASDAKQKGIIDVLFWNTGGSRIYPKSSSFGSLPLVNEQQQRIVRQQVQIDLVDQVLPSEIQLNFALIDVERMQLKALRGMRKVIDRSPNLVIMTEWQYGIYQDKNKQNTIQFLQWMIKKGYKIYTYVANLYLPCSVGNFSQYKDIQQLLLIDDGNLFFFPSTVPLPQGQTNTIEPINPNFAKGPLLIGSQKIQKARSNTNNSSIPFYCWNDYTIPQPLTDNTKREKLVRTLYGFNMYIDSKDNLISTLIKIGGTWQPNNINLIGHFVKSGDSILNLGSQSGLQAVIMGKIVGLSGKLYIFEPYSFSNFLVTKNIQYNGLENITKIYKIGASDQKIIAQMSIYYANTGNSHIRLNSDFVDPSVKMTIPDEKQMVQTGLIDQILPQNSQIDFALIDVEGMEVKALRGMKKLIERSPNLVILSEWRIQNNSKTTKKDTAQFLEWMSKRGYKFYTYAGGDVNTCTVGDFSEQKDIEALLNIVQENILFVPSNVIVPQKGQKKAKFIQNIQDKTNIIDSKKQAIKFQDIDKFKKQPNQVNINNKTTQRPFYCSFTRAVPTPLTKGQNREKQVSTNYGFNMFIDTLDAVVSYTIWTTGTWQPGYISLIGHIVKQSDSVINLGSQTGLQALVMGKIVGPTGRLFIFEPYSFSNQLITKSVQLNNLTNITTIYKIGASDHKQSGVIKLAYQNTGMALITSNSVPKMTFAAGDEPQKIQQQVVQLDLVDSLLPEDVILNFALLDVEKMEIKALKGMKKVIERSSNLIIMVQWQYANNPNHNEAETLQFLDWMVKRGYKIYTYSGGDINLCTLGTFMEYTNLKDLFNFIQIDLFFFPKTVALPS